MRYISFLLIFLGYSAISQSIATDRPSALTENSTSLYKNGIQLESGFLIQLDSGETQPISAPNLLLRYGLTEKTELRLMNDVLVDEENVELGVWTIGAKIQLYKSDKVNLSVLPSIQIPSVYDDIGSLSEQPINTKIIGNYVVSKANSVGYTIGYTFNNNEIGYSLFLGHNFTDKISTFIELYGFNDQLNIDAGLAYLIQDKLQFDAYFGTGLNNKMVFASVGLSYLYLK
ncbi:transporter [Bacteroidota bacterium]|nr:transporter [Bacteroidota bacterium]